MQQNPYEQTDFLPPAKKNAWIYVIAALVIVSISTLVLRTVYKNKTVEEKKRSFGLIKRSTPARFSNYTLIFSSADTNIAKQIANDVAAEIGADSLITEMVVAGTAIYQHTASLAEYRHLIRRALTKAGEADIYKQSLLFAQLVGVMQIDTLPVRFHLAGSIAPHSGSSLPERFAGTARDLSIRHQKLGRVEVVSYLQPDSSRDMKNFLSEFEKRNIPLVQK